MVCIYQQTKPEKKRKGKQVKKSESKNDGHDEDNNNNNVQSDRNDTDSDLILCPGEDHKDEKFTRIDNLNEIVGQTVIDILHNKAATCPSGLFGSSDIILPTDKNHSTNTSSLSDLLNLDPDLVNMLVQNNPSLVNLMEKPEVMDQIPMGIEVKLPVELTYDEMAYFEYYCKKILPDLSILPQEFNYYSRIYVPMAFKEKAVLYTLVGWGCRMRKNRNLSYQVENKEADKYIQLVNSIIDENNILLDRGKFITNFVCYMLLVCMEISYGDTLRWSHYFTCCFKMINRMPGDFKYLFTQCSSEGAVLAENFAYFDVLASQSNENGTFYPIDDYRELFSSSSSMHDPLQGCIRPLILLIGEIVSLLVEFSSMNVSLEMPECDKYDFLSKMMERSSDLDHRIKFARPDLTCLHFLKSRDEMEYHLTLFEAYQLSAQIYLREVIRKLPPVVPEMEVLAYNLREDMKFLVNCKRLQKILAFPMLLLGTSSTGKNDRAEVEQMFDKLIQSCGYLSSYQKLWIVVQKIWELNKSGALYVDWFKVTREFGWRLNLGR